MGVYIFNTDVLIPVLLKDAEDPESRHDFGHDILPKMVDDYKIYSFNFIDENKKEALYWRDVGTLDAYYEANMDLVSVSPVFNLYDSTGRCARISGSIRRRSSSSPSRDERERRGFDHLVWMHRLRRRGAQSVFSPDVRVNSYAEVDSSIVFSHVNIGRHCRIRKAIIDRDVHIPEGTVIGYDPEADRQRYFVTDTGITVVTRDYSLFESPVAVDYYSPE